MLEDVTHQTLRSLAAAPNLEVTFTLVYMISHRIRFAKKKKATLFTYSVTH